MNNNRLKWFQDQKTKNRFWWFNRKGNDYLPPLYRDLSDKDFSILMQWFDKTEKLNMMGECNIPAMQTMLGFIAGSNLDRIVQIGHYSGWSTLMFGWMLRRMGKRRGLYTIDIQPKCTKITKRFVDMAGLQGYVEVVTADGGDTHLPDLATSYLKGAAPKMVFIDSDHTFDQAVKEILLWHDALEPGGVMFLHDVSEYAQRFDKTNQGGVHDAFIGCVDGDVLDSGMLGIALNRVVREGHELPLVVQDGCGLGIIQKVAGWK